MLNRIFQNWPLKLLAVVAAVLVWFVIMMLADPTDTQTYYNIPVKLLNEELLTQANKSYTVEGGATPTVSIRVSAAGSVHRELTAADFTATADVSKMFDVTGRVPIEVVCSNTSLSRQISSITPQTETLKINFEDIVTQEFTIDLRTRNDLPDGYFISRQWTSPSTVTVAAPASVMERISSVVAEVDVTGLTESTTLENSPLRFLSGTGQALALDTARDTTVSTDAVTVGLDIFTMKTIPVVISQAALDKVKNEVSDGYRYIKATQTVSSVQVKGLPSRLADISMISIPESALNLRGAKESRSFNLALSDYLPAGIELMDGQESRITITLEVVELDVREFTIDTLRVSGMDEDYRYQFSRTVTVYIRALEADFSGFNLSAVSASLDLGEYATMEGTHRLEVTVSCSDSVFTPLPGKTFAVITVTKYIPPTEPPTEPTTEPETDENGDPVIPPEETLPPEDEDSIGA